MTWRLSAAVWRRICARWRDSMVTNRTIDEVIRALKRLVRQWEEPVVGRYKDDPFTTLISCLLSLRTQDATTSQASERLFRLARTPQTMLKLPRRTIERAIYPVSFIGTKRGRCRRFPAR